jgi:hypothetical protein
MWCTSVVLVCDRLRCGFMESWFEVMKAVLQTSRTYIASHEDASPVGNATVMSRAQQALLMTFDKPLPTNMSQKKLSQAIANLVMPNAACLLLQAADAAGIFDLPDPDYDAPTPEGVTWVIDTDAPPPEWITSAQSMLVHASDDDNEEETAFLKRAVATFQSKGDYEYGLSTENMVGLGNETARETLGDTSESEVEVELAERIEGRFSLSGVAPLSKSKSVVPSDVQQSSACISADSLAHAAEVSRPCGADGSVESELLLTMSDSEEISNGMREEAVRCSSWGVPVPKVVRVSTFVEGPVEATPTGTPKKQGFAHTSWRLCGRGRMVERDMRSLVDNGADISILSMTQARHLPSGARCRLARGDPEQIELADSAKTVPILGTVTLWIRFQDRKCQHRFFICDLPDVDAIIGTDFMGKFGSVISYENDKAVFMPVGSDGHKVLIFSY